MPTNNNLKSISYSQIKDKGAFLVDKKIGDLSIFDVKKIKGEYKRDYYRIRKGNYRSIFYLDKKNIYVVAIGNRKEIYKKWE